jgi:hypothetical protein
MSIPSPNHLVTNPPMALFGIWSHADKPRVHQVYVLRYGLKVKEEEEEGVGWGRVMPVSF